MPSGNKKKKTKVTANPARGFATTSVASKPKPDEQHVSEVHSESTASVATPGEHAISHSSHSQEHKTDSFFQKSQGKELHELSPDELEAELQASEVYRVAEQHGPRVKKETGRQVTRLQTDKRLLRGQATFLSVREWLPDELMQQVLDLIQGDLTREQDAVKKHKLPIDNDLVVKVWQLRQILIGLTIPLSRIKEVLGWIVLNPPADSSSSAWGVEECLQWLALNCEQGELEDYDYEKPKPIATVSLEVDSTTQKAAPQRLRTSADSSSDPVRANESNGQLITEEDTDISDLGSDVEPEELLSIYLQTKAKLYTLNPGALDNKAVPVTPKHFPKPQSQRKLEQKLQKIESDVLFDKREADAHWTNQRIGLAREVAERHRLQLQNGNGTSPVRSSGSIALECGVNDEAEKLGGEVLAESAQDEDMLGGMFDALPGVNGTVGSGLETGSSECVTIRDFGRLTGMNPKRVLEEACKARDPRCNLTYRLMSPTTYSSRHSVTIQWTKDQESIDEAMITDVAVSQKPSYLTITMIRVATPDVSQSEAYVAVATLFLVFSGSPKEEKAHLRLPPAYRNLWDEFAHTKQQYIFATDAAVVRDVQELIDKNRTTDDDEIDEVVFNAKSRRRLENVSGVATPVTRTTTPKLAASEFSENLQQMWQRKTSTPAYQRILAARMNLPMFQFREATLDSIQRHQVTILCGETGCGKSTQLPAFILENELLHGKECKIYCTEPRRISAISLAQRVSEEMGESKGDLGTSRSLVGYAIRLETQTTAQTRLVYATVGIVLRMLENSAGLSDITHLVIDEVHERSIDTDFLLIVLQSLMLKRPDLKVVLMSATVDAQRFSQYLGGAPIINVPGRTFPVEAKFLEDAIELTGHTNEDATQNAVDDDRAEDDAQDQVERDENQLQGYSKRTQNILANYDEYRIDYSLILKLLKKVATQAQFRPFSRAILVFLPGIAEIRQLNDMIAGDPTFQKGWRLHPLHSTFSSEEQQAAFEVPPDTVRKIVMATNIAETGITIPDVTCVIDTGTHKEMRFDERRQMARLIQSFIARANAKQRRGRAGRVQPGICFHLFTKHRHDNLMIDQQTPEMLRLSLQDIVMRVKICKLGDTEEALAQALDPPSSKNIRRAIDALVEVGALTEREELTTLGTQLAKLPLDAQLGKLILLGSSFGCLDFALTVAAALSSKSPFLSPMHAKKQADTVRLGFKRGDSDLLTVFNAYSVWRRTCTTPGLSEYQFCNKNFLSPQNLGNIEELKAQLLTTLSDAGFVQLGPDEKSHLFRMRHGRRHRDFVSFPAQYTRSDDNDVLASSVVAWSFYPKIIKQDGKGWRNIANNQSLGLHPTSVNRLGTSPDIKYLSFYSVMQSSSRFTNAQETSPVAEMTLLLLSGEATFHMYAGVVVIDGNRLRVKLRDWRTMIILKTLRSKLKEAMAKQMKTPGRELGDRPRRWMELLVQMFERQKSLLSPSQIR